VPDDSTAATGSGCPRDRSSAQQRRAQAHTEIERTACRRGACACARHQSWPAPRKNPDDLGRKTAKSGIQLPILVTKLFTPPRAVESISRPRLVEQKDSGLARELTLVARRQALANRRCWANRRPNDRPSVWFSLDQGERDVQQFLAHLVAAVQTVDASIGASAWAMLQTSPPPSAGSVLTALLYEVAENLEAILQVLDE